MNNLQQLEIYSNQLYTNQTQQIHFFTIEQCQEIFQSSTNQYTQFHAIKSLQQFLNEHCKLPNPIKINSLTMAIRNGNIPITDSMVFSGNLPIKNEVNNELPNDYLRKEQIQKIMQNVQVIKTLVKQFLFTKNQQLHQSVVNSSINLLVELISKYWIHNSENVQEIIEIVTIIEKQIESSIILFPLLMEIILSISSSKSLNRRALQHFKDHCLKNIVTLAFKTLQLCMTQQFNKKDIILLRTIELITTSMKYNFSSVLCDDSTEELTQIHLPNDWNCYINIEFINQLLTIYYQCSSIELLGTMGLIKRTFWQGKENEAIQFKHHLMNGILTIITNGHDLNNEQTLFSICKFFDRFRILVHVPQILPPNHIKLIVEFSVQIIKNWYSNQHSLTFLLNFWSRTIRSIQYSSEIINDPLYLDTAFELCKMLVTSVYQFYDQFDYQSEITVIDIDEYPLLHYMDSFGTLARAKYQEMSQFINQQVETIRTNLSQIKNQNEYNSPLRKKLQTQLWFLLNTVNALLTRQHISDDIVEKIQAILVGQVFRCITLSDSMVKYRNKEIENTVEMELEYEYLKFFL